MSEAFRGIPSYRYQPTAVEALRITNWPRHLLRDTGRVTGIYDTTGAT